MRFLDKRILLVEDNPDDVFLTIDALRQNNIVNAVDVVGDGQEALDYLFGEGKHAGRDIRIMPAIVLLDVNLPKLNGIDVLRRIRSDIRTKRLTVIMLTTSGEQQDLINSYSLGCNSYICKPVDMDHFIKAVQQVGTYWLDFNKSPPKAE